jgi:CheY-like chemotaxis protein
MAKVLLVEDDNNLREIYEARLQAEGYEISSAQDGEEALVVAKKFKPDLIISDVMMPKISGFEMLDILRNTEGLEHTRVIMLTALGQAEDKTRADTLGADRYLVKSQVTLEDIVKSAHEILDGDSAVPAPVGESSTPPVTPTATDTPTNAAPADPAPSEPAAPAEPVTPAGGPAVDPMPATEPVAQQPSETPAPDSQQTSNPGSAADEQATVDKQIQDFVNNVPAEAPASATGAADDALLAEAADSLAGSNPVPEPAPEPAPEPVPAPEPATPEPKPAPTNDNVTIAHKKVIEPPSSQGKPSLDELLAKEEARESGLPTSVTAASSAPAVEESEDFKLPEGASEDSSLPPEVAAEPAASASSEAVPEPAAEPQPVAEPPAENAAPAVTTDMPSGAPAPSASGAPTAPAAPKKPDDFDPHSVAL